MKTRYIVGLFLVGASVLSSCYHFTEIDQKTEYTFSPPLTS